MAVCNDFVAMLQTMFNNPNTYPPGIMSISYLECEAFNGASRNAAFSNAYQTGVAEGWSIFVAAGDEGAGVCNFGGQTVTDGVGVNGLGSTVYNVAVGGTDFGDTFAGQDNTYWSATNSATFGSALSYVPKFPGTRLAAASCSRPLKASPRPTAHPDSATAVLSRRHQTDSHLRTGRDRAARACAPRARLRSPA